MQGKTKAAHVPSSKALPSSRIYYQCQLCQGKRHGDALLLEIPKNIYLSTSFAREDIVLHRTFQIVIHDCIGAPSAGARWRMM